MVFNSERTRYFVGSDPLGSSQRFPDPLLDWGGLYEWVEVRLGEKRKGKESTEGERLEGMERKEGGKDKPGVYTP